MTKKKKRLYILLVFIVLCLAIVAFRYLYPTFVNKTVRESKDNIGQPITPSTPTDNQANSPAPKERTGEFVGVAGHSGSGTATVLTTTQGNFIRLGENFSVTNGPDLYIYVGDSNGSSKQVAELKGNRGSQNYQLPDDITLTSFSYVWIHCKAFNVDFAKAELKTKP